MIFDVGSSDALLEPHLELKSDYMSIHSLEQFVFIWILPKQIEVYTRETSGWHFEVYLESGEFEVACVGQKVTLEQIYGGVKL